MLGIAAPARHQVLERQGDRQMKNLLRAACALAMAVAPAAADAATFDFRFSFEQWITGKPSGDIYTAAGTLEADDIGKLYVVRSADGRITNNINDNVVAIEGASSILAPFLPASFWLSDGEPAAVDIAFNWFGFTASYLKGSIAIGSANLEAVGPLTTVSITPKMAAPAVPEPATWALMIAGFGTVGYAMRRRRARIAYAV